MKVMIKRSLGLLVLVAMGVFSPQVVYALEEETVGHQPTIVNAELTEAIAQTAADDTVSRVNIEEQFDAVENGFSREYTFSGSANELVVVYVESEESRYAHALELYDPAGQWVNRGYNYPDEFDFQHNNDGYYVEFLLPETGEYRLVFEIDAAETVADYRLQVRPATYYERLMISVNELANEARYEETLPLLALAIENSPERSGGYMTRAFVYAGMLFDTPEFEDRFDELEQLDGLDDSEYADALFDLVYETFLTLEETEQSLVIGDMRQLDRLYIAAVESGEIESDDFEPMLFSGVADFLETGVPTAAMRQMFFGTATPVE